MKKENQIFDIESQLVDSSRFIIDMVTANVGNNPDYFKAAWDLAISEKPQVSPRAARVVYYNSLQYSYLFDPYESLLINKLSNIKNESVLFNLVHLLSEREMPENENDFGILADYCFETVIKASTKPALKVYCLEVLYKICLIEPDLKQELIAIIEEQMPLSTMAFTSRGKRMLKKLYL